ncbi:glycosyltransferase, partial [Lysobacter sp. 2RAB21]
RLHNIKIFIYAPPHYGFFPRLGFCSQLGAAATTGAAPRAGIPSVFVPFFGDPPFWARRMNELGTAPPALDRRTVNAEQMAQAINDALQPQRIQAARELGEKIHAENGTATAVRTLGEWGLLPPLRGSDEATAPAAAPAELELVQVA